MIAATTSVEVHIEVPRGGFSKRDSARRLEFLSPVPCPFNYGAAPALAGADGAALDAVVLGPRLPAGARLYCPVQAVVRFIDADQEDDKLVCAAAPLSAAQGRMVLGFFRVYAVAKRVINAVQGHAGATRCAGWGDVAAVLCRAEARAAAARAAS